MAVRRDHHGRPASPGLATGPVHRAEERAVAEVGISAPADARASLEAAVTRAVRELRDLADRADAESAGILDVQIELLLDGELVAPALERIGRGEGVALAWASTMDEHIDTLAGAGDDAFALRAADLSDVRYRVLDALAGRARADFPPGAVYVGRDMPPSLFLAHDWSRGGAIALAAGSAASHVAMLARARGVPMVVGLGHLPVETGDILLVNGGEGVVRLDPEETPSICVPSVRDVPAFPEGDGRPVRLLANINSLADLDALDPLTVDGIGLVRTEFLLPTAAEALDEERHLAAYRCILERLPGKQVTFRLFDLGGDKTLPGLVESDPTSALGLRGVRVLLAHPELARLQARALIRAGAFGMVRVLVPMVTVPDELTQIARLFDEEAMRLTQRGIAGVHPPLGMMVEVPAAALTLDLFTDVAFFSVGTNDLMQYLAAAARDNPAVAPLAAGSETAMFRLIDHIAATAHSLGRPVCVCGDLAGEPAALARLLATDLDEISVAPYCLPAIRAALAGSPAIEGLGCGN